MPKYYQPGYTWPAAALDGLAPMERQGLQRYGAARARELSTIETVEIECKGGPLHGQTIELQSTTGKQSTETAEFCMGAWRGRYVNGTWTPSTETTTGAESTHPATPQETTPAPRRAKLPRIDFKPLGKGYDALRELLGDLAQNPSERATFNRPRHVDHSVKYGITDDFGNTIENPAPFGAWQTVRTISRTQAKPGKKSAYVETLTTRHSSDMKGYQVHPLGSFMDDFGNLETIRFGETYYGAAVRRVDTVTIAHPELWTAYTIGRTRYTIRATPEACETLAKKILAKKSHFADKVLTTSAKTLAALATQKATDIAEQAQTDARNAEAVARFNAGLIELQNKTTAQATHAAQSTAATLATGHALATAAHSAQQATTATTAQSHAAPALAMASEASTGHSPAPAPRHPAPPSYTSTPETCTAPPETFAAPVDRAQIAIDIERNSQKIIDTFSTAIDRANPNNPEKTRQLYLSEAARLLEVAATMAAPLAQVAASYTRAAHALADKARSNALATPTPRAEFFATLKAQQLKSKTGAWKAWFYTDSAARPCLAFLADPANNPGAEPVYSHHATGAARMAELQRLARLADAAHLAAQTPATQPTSTPTPETPAPTKRKPASIESMRRTIRACNWSRNDLSGATASEFKNMNVPARLTPHLEAVQALQIPARFTADIEAQAWAIECAKKTIARWTALQTPSTTPETPAPAGLVDTPQDLSAPPPAPAQPTAPTPNTPGALQITITRAEGLASECGRPVTVHTFAAADALLRTWSETAPKTGGYDKRDFSITWPDGGQYDGRYDLQHHTREVPSLARHMIDMAEYSTGKFCPPHMSATAYAQDMQRTDEGTRAAYAHVLQTMAALGAYTPKVRPVACDLAELVARGVTPAQFVGMGCTYHGDRCNSDGVGAITSAAIDTRYKDNAHIYGTVTLEDGRTMHFEGRDFGDRASHFYRLDLKRHGAPYLAQLAAAVATTRARETSAQEQARAQHLQALQDLKAQHPNLQQYTPGGKLGGPTLAAANCRTLLKQAFPGVKFSVRTDRFSGGSFDGMTDSYTYNACAFTELFGSAKYTFTTRSLSDAAIQTLINQEWPDAATRPTLADYHRGDRNTHDSEGRSRVWLASHTWTPNT